MNQLASSVEILGQTVGRALLVSREGVLYASRGYRIYRSEDWGKSWLPDCRLLAKTWKSAAAGWSWSARLLRHYIAALQLLSDGTRVAIARDGIYRAAPGESVMRRTFALTRGSRPLNLCVDNQDRILFGEYGGNPARYGIFLYASADRGQTFQVIYEFPAGEIRHVHNLLYDQFLDGFWVLVGDYGQEPGIGFLSKTFDAFDWLVRGSQRVRAVCAILEQDHLTYGTDTELEQNYIIRLDKKSGKLEPLRETQGTSLYATRFGDARLISTCVEPSKVNSSPIASVYCSYDGEKWDSVQDCRKDFLPPHLFQFGTVVLPYSGYAQPRGIWSGQAVSRIDNRTEIVSFNPSANK